jgi:peptide/nickel transport system substrate-binding protein
MRTFAVMFLLSLLILSSFAPFAEVPNARFVSFAQTQSCPSTQELKMTTFPLPASFNMLTSTTLSGYIMAALLEQTVYPYAVLPNGSLYWQNSVTDNVTHNANYSQWTFHVKPGLKWSDGTNVRAQDILNTYSDSYAFNSSYDLVNAGPEVVSTATPNSQTAVFNLNVSDAHFAERISLMIFENVQPPSAIRKGPGASLFDQNVTDGPFYISQPYVSGSPQVLLSRNQYFNPTPGPCQLLVNFVEQSSQLSEFLTSGRTDLAGPLDPSSVSAILQNPSIHILDEKGMNVMSLEYNITSYPYNMTTFRQALAYGINQSQIQSQSLAGYSLNAYNAEGDVPPNVGVYNPNIVKYSYNPSKAIQLLSSIGITKGSDGYLQYPNSLGRPNGTDVAINLVTDSDQTFDVSAASVAQSNLQSLGFKVNSQVLAGSTITGDFPSNANNIQHALILYTSIGGAFFPNPWTDARPGVIVYQLSYGVGFNYWEYPPDINALYQGNVSAIENTSDISLETKYIGNIQALSAQYLPTIILGYPDELWAYNTQRWTNWPTSPNAYVYDGDWVNQTLLASLKPTGASSTSNGSIGNPSYSNLYLIAAVVGVVVVAGVAYAFVRRGRK